MINNYFTDKSFAVEVKFKDENEYSDKWTEKSKNQDAERYEKRHKNTGKPSVHRLRSITKIDQKDKKWV